MLLCNALMMSFFLKSLHDSGSLTATVINTAVNFVLTVRVGTHKGPAPTPHTDPRRSDAALPAPALCPGSPR
jgi:hypothetical protein